MRARLHTAALAAAIDNTPIPFLIEGTASQPVFRPDLRAVVNERVKGLQGTAEKAAGNLLKGWLGGIKR